MPKTTMNDEIQEYDNFTPGEALKEIPRRIAQLKSVMKNIMEKEMNRATCDTKDTYVEKITREAIGMVESEIRDRSTNGANYCSMLRLYRNGTLGMDRELSPCYSESEYYGKPGAPLTIWSCCESTEPVSTEDRENGEENGIAFGWMAFGEVIGDESEEIENKIRTYVDDLDNLE